MSFFKHQLKKLSLLLFVALAIAISNMLPLQAQGTASVSASGGASGGGSSATQLLQQIANNTQGILTNVNNLPASMSNIAASALNLVSADPDPNNSASVGVISNFQTNFVNLANYLITNSTAQIALQPTLSNTLFTDQTTQTALNPMPTNANDLTYQTLLGRLSQSEPRTNATTGKPYTVAQDAQNFITNASGITLYHVAPVSLNGTSIQAKATYTNYYNTVNAAESYSAFILSDMYASSQNPNGPFTTLQTALIQQASDPKSWFAQISSENIGQVIRQILMFESQSYVLLSEMLKTQKQMLYAQAMANAVIIANGANDEHTLLLRAQGAMPRGG